MGQRYHEIHEQSYDCPKMAIRVIASSSDNEHPSPLFKVLT